MEAAVNTLEFQLREMNTGGFPKVRRHIISNSKITIHSVHTRSHPVNAASIPSSHCTQLLAPTHTRSDPFAHPPTSTHAHLLSTSPHPPGPRLHAFDAAEVDLP